MLDSWNTLHQSFRKDSWYNFASDQSFPLGRSWTWLYLHRYHRLKTRRSMYARTETLHDVQLLICCFTTIARHSFYSIKIRMTRFQHILQSKTPYKIHILIFLSILHILDTKSIPANNITIEQCPSIITHGHNQSSITQSETSLLSFHDTAITTCNLRLDTDTGGKINSEDRSEAATQCL